MKEREKKTNEMILKSIKYKAKPLDISNNYLDIKLEKLSELTTPSKKALKD